MSGTGWQRILVLASVVGFVEALLFAVSGAAASGLRGRPRTLEGGRWVFTSGLRSGRVPRGLPSIWAARRFGVKATVVAGLILLAVSSTAFVVPETPWLVFAAIGQGAGSAFAYTGALAWLAAVAPPARRGELIGVTFAAAFSGELVGPLVGAVAAWVGLALGFSIVAALAVLIAALAAAIPRPPRAERLAAPSLRALVSNRVVDVAAWLIALTALLLGVLGVLAPLRWTSSAGELGPSGPSSQSQRCFRLLSTPASAGWPTPEATRCCCGRDCSCRRGVRAPRIR